MGCGAAFGTTVFSFFGITIGTTLGTHDRANIGPTISTLPWWLKNVMPYLKIKPIECVQHPGEVLFVPNGWFHAVFNIDEVVGIAFEIGHDKLISDIVKSKLNFKRQDEDEDETVREDEEEEAEGDWL